jgi:hypothetical protein
MNAFAMKAIPAKIAANATNPASTNARVLIAVTSSGSSRR